MGVDAKHPLYTEFELDWRQMRDTYRGQRVVKAARGRYLPPTAGMITDGIENTQAEGFKAYMAYLSRAVFPDVVRQAVEAMLGVMHRKPPVIELPESMAPLLERATLKNESLEMLLRRINEEQLTTSRCGLLAEPVDGPGLQLPFIAFYRAEDIINWDEGRRTGIELENLNLVVLDETEFERSFTASSGTFDWERRRKYRVLVLGDPDVNEPAGEGVYRVGIFRETTGVESQLSPGENSGLEFRESGLVTPMVAGNVANEIPFEFINSKDVVADPEEPVLLGLSNMALTIYRTEADYRQALFMQGQDTLVTIGHISETPGQTQHRIGAGASIDLPIGGDAKFIGADSGGLPEMRMALENDRTQASRKAGEMIDETSRQRESEGALKVRVAARTATLNQIALAGAFGLQELLRKIARWIGADPDEVIVTPNLDFTDDEITGKELAELMGAKMLGAPIAHETIHRIMEDRGMSSLTFEEELELIEKEEEIEVLRGTAGSTSEDGPEDDEEPEEAETDDEEGEDAEEGEEES